MNNSILAQGHNKMMNKIQSTTKDVTIIITDNLK